MLSTHFHLKISTYKHFFLSIARLSLSVYEGSFGANLLNLSSSFTCCSCLILGKTAPFF